MTKRIAIILLSLAAVALAGDVVTLPVQWIISVKLAADMSDADKTRLRDSLRQWTGQTNLQDIAVTSHLRAKGAAVRRFAFWQADQFGKTNLTQAKADAWCAGFVDPNAVVVTSSPNPKALCVSLGWTNLPVVNP